MKVSKNNKSSFLESFFDILYEESGNAVGCIIPNNYTFKTPQQVINFNADLYDAFHGVNGWHYNLLTGRLEKEF